MKFDRIIKKYAQILIETAIKIDAVDSVSQSLKVLSFILKKDAMFRAFFQSPKIEPEEKRRIIKVVFQNKCHPLVSELFEVLAEKREYRLFHSIVKVFENLRRKELNLIQIKAITAEKLPPVDYERIRETLLSITDKNAELEFKVEPEMVGGIKLRLGNLYLDGSLKSGLEKMRQVLIQK